MHVDCRGSSLVEVMVSVGISMISLAVMTSIISNNQKSMRLSEIKMAEMSLVNDMVTTISDDTACAAALSNQPMTGVPNNAPVNFTVRSGINNFVLDHSGTKLSGYEDLAVEKLYLNGGTAAGGNTYDSVELWVQLKTDKDVAGPRTFKPKKVGVLNIVTNGATIQSCEGAGASSGVASPSVMCKALGGTYSSTAKTCDTAKRCPASGGLGKTYTNVTSYPTGAIRGWSTGNNGNIQTGQEVCVNGTWFRN